MAELRWGRLRLRWLSGMCTAWLPSWSEGCPPPSLIFDGSAQDLTLAYQNIISFADDDVVLSFVRLFFLVCALEWIDNWLFSMHCLAFFFSFVRFFIGFLFFFLFLLLLWGVIILLSFKVSLVRVPLLAILFFLLFGWVRLLLLQLFRLLVAYYVQVQPRDPDAIVMFSLDLNVFLVSSLKGVLGLNPIKNGTKLTLQLFGFSAKLLRLFEKLQKLFLSRSWLEQFLLQLPIDRLDHSIMIK